MLNANQRRPSRRLWGAEMLVKLRLWWQSLPWWGKILVVLLLLSVLD